MKTEKKKGEMPGLQKIPKGSPLQPLMGPLSLLFVAFFVTVLSGPIRNTNYGQVEGFYSGSTEIYYSIPYASPPINDLRWSPPVRPAPWTGTLPATSMAKFCMQAGSVFGSNFETSEDCLYLNIYVPVNVTNAPVMVWIHGGAYILGSFFCSFFVFVFSYSFFFF